MKLSVQVIHFFEHLAANAHHQVPIDELLANQSDEIKKIFSSSNSENLKNQFSNSGYLADSIKVTDL